VPCTRATVSASLARSSGSRTVVCFVMQPRYHDIIVDRAPVGLNQGGTGTDGTGNLGGKSQGTRLRAAEWFRPGVRS
jgi:hypothetical protein